MEAGADQQANRRQRVYCDCCRGWSVQPGFAIAPAAGGDLRRVCTRCASHVSLKADGGIWIPVECPDRPRPRLRVYRRICSPGSGG
ncbi:MAG: hypothetical protein ACR2JY_17735 [Chloroflexota bacterium]